MNVLFIFDSPFISSNGGVERVSNLLAEEFKRQEIGVCFLSIGEKTGEDDASKKIYNINISNNRAFDKFKTIIISEKIDIIIIQVLKPEILKIISKLPDNKPKIISIIHNQPFPTLGKERKFKQLSKPVSLKGKLQKLTGIVFPSVYRAARIRYDSGLMTSYLKVSDKLCLLSSNYEGRILPYVHPSNHNKIISINNPNTFPHLTAGKTDKENIVLYVGRLIDPQKNLRDFIDSWKIFNKRNPTWKALIIGDGPDRQNYEDYSQKRKVKNIEFLGNQKDVGDFYSKAKIFCMTSLYEGWPMVLPEAMAHGCVPVVFDTFEGLHDIVEDGVSGLIVKPFDTKEMAEKLNILANNDSYREGIANAARISINKNDIKTISGKWISLFRNLQSS